MREETEPVRECEKETAYTLAVYLLNNDENVLADIKLLVCHAGTSRDICSLDLGIMRFSLQ